ncbi:Zdhhc3, partial [Symbiodinium sp. CCMP2456]
ERMQIDLAQEIPVPSEPPSPAQRRELEEGGESPTKRPATSSRGTVALDMQDLERLLAQHADRILQAQHAHLEARLGSLEEVLAARVGGTETRLDTVETKVESLEAKIEELTKELREKPVRGQFGRGVEDRRLTLIFGGWPRDSRRGDILAGLDKALQGLQIKHLLDNEAFCTGPRRSSALAVFEHRQGESDYQTKRRLHQVVQCIADNEVKLPGGRKLFATYAKTREEREIASHAAWLKRTILHVAPRKIDLLDLEYATGGGWIGQSFVASAKVPVPPGLHPEDMLFDEDKDNRPWIWVSGIAKELGLPAATIRAIFPLISWNIGGASVTDLPQTVADAVGNLQQDALLSFQELSRDEPGWHTAQHGQWTLLQHRQFDVWRGTGIAFRPDRWRVMRRKGTERGLWLRLRHVQGLEIWAGTAHFTPGCTQAQHAKEVGEHLTGLPPTAIPTFLTCDINAEVGWGFDDEGICRATGNNGKTQEFLGQCLQRGLRPVPPPPEDFRTPTSRPRQANRRGKQIDGILCNAGSPGPLRIFQGSCSAIGTDHELVATTITLHTTRAGTRFSTQPRVWTGGIADVGELTQGRLTELAKKHTAPRRGVAYVDPPEVKHAFRRAKHEGVPRLWTQARALRKKARSLWEQERLERATKGDWAEVRRLKPTKHVGWDIEFAEANQDQDPHAVVHEHLQGIYSTGQVLPPASP